MMEQLPDLSLPVKILLGTGAAFLLYRFVFHKRVTIQKDNKVGGDMAGGNIVKTDINAPEKNEK